MASRTQRFFPALSVKDKQSKAVWLEYDSGKSEVSLVVGNGGEGTLSAVNTLAGNLSRFLEPAIEIIDHSTYLVALSCGENFRLRTWWCRVTDDKVLKSKEINDGNAKCGAFDFARGKDGLVVVWESWGKDGVSILKRGTVGVDGTIGNIRDLIPDDGVSANWPSAAMIGDELWVSFCVPNPERTGYDCFLAVDSGEDVTYWRLSQGYGLFNLYPELSEDPEGRPWITWVRETDQEYYNLTGQIANGEYCCLQDPISRARRRILWNATEPVVMRLRKNKDEIIGEWREPTGSKRGDEENQTIHYPSLRFTNDGSPIMIFDRYRKASFETRFSRVGRKNDAEDFFYRETDGNSPHLLPQRTKGRTELHDNELHILGEVTQGDMRQRNLQESVVEMKSIRVDSSVETLTRKGERIFPRTETPRAHASETNDASFGNIHIHTEVSRCRRDTQQSLDFNYRWAMDLMGQEFTAIADHIQDLSPAHWRYSLSLIDFFQFPDRHAALPAYEWATKFPDGHANVIFPDTKSALKGYVDASVNTLKKLWESLEGVSAMTISHHTGTYPMHRDWSIHHPDFEPLVEIFQDRRGNFEYPDAPWIPGEGCPEQGSERKEATGFVNEALRRGHKLGFCSGGDHMGLSMTGVHASTFTSEELFRLLRTRACFGTSKRGVSVEMEAFAGENRAKMGGAMTLGGARPRIHVKANACSDIEYVALIHDATEHVRIEGDSKRAVDSVVEVRKPVSYLYARVMLNDGNMAWSSPIWFLDEQPST